MYLICSDNWEQWSYANYPFGAFRFSRSSGRREILTAGGWVPALPGDIDLITGKTKWLKRERREVPDA